MMESESIAIKNVLIVEDHRDALDVLERVAKKTFNNPTTISASTLTQGFEALQKNHFDIALLDIGLPDGNGIELVKHISKNSPDTLSVVTTIFDDDGHLFDALRSGACGYLLKGHSASELEHYLLDAVSGRPALSPSIAQSMLGFFRDSQIDNSVAVSNGYEENLTEREMEILRLIAKGCQVKEVSKLLDISANTVSHHIKNIYSKLNVHNRAEATAAAVHLNLFKPEPNL
ncbi:MAG: response regulator transcription factor [Pseudomonadales bacterium]|nr:response regulator transcription factor [Pseudomonadales bacterium]